MPNWRNRIIASGEEAPENLLANPQNWWRHPAFQENVVRLRGWGVRVLYGDDVLALPEPGNGDALRHEFPWHLALHAVDELLAAASTEAAKAGEFSTT